MTEKLREYKQDIVDLLDGGGTLDPKMTTGPELKMLSITESEIASFCFGCDLSTETPCKRVGANDQARYAARGYCPWAEVKGRRITKKN